MPVASFAPEVATLVALGVGVDYSLFVVSRHRTGLLAGQGPEEAAVIALNTSGRAVLLAGTTVCVAILGLFALQVSFLYGVAVSIALAVALTMLTSLTLLPAMLGFLGPEVLRRAERATAGTQSEEGPGGWHRWAQLVSRRAAVSGVLAFAAIVVLALPFFSMRPGLPDASTGPATSTTSL
jgi:putative drug exporter of the RND superfamily